MGYKFRLQPGAEERIYNQISDIVFHKGRDEINMPDLLSNEISVELPAQARRAYSDMQDEFVALTGDGGIISAPTASTMYNKLRQIAAGAVYTKHPNWVTIHDAKIEAVKELADSLDGRPLMIFYDYKHDQARLAEAFPEMEFLGGGVSSKDTASNRSSLERQ